MKHSVLAVAVCLLLGTGMAAQVVPQRHSVLAHKPEKPPQSFSPIPSMSGRWETNCIS